MRRTSGTTSFRRRDDGSAILCTMCARDTRTSFGRMRWTLPLPTLRRCRRSLRRTCTRRRIRRRFFLFLSPSSAPSDFRDEWRCQCARASHAHHAMARGSGDAGEGCDAHTHPTRLHAARSDSNHPRCNPGHCCWSCDYNRGGHESVRTFGNGGSRERICMAIDGILR